MAQGKKITDSTRSERIFVLYQFLVRNTCKGHSAPVEKGEDSIYSHLRSMDMDVSINTLYADLELLRLPPFNLNIKYDRHQHGYYVANPPFDRQEIRWMIDGIQSAKFITQDKAREITKKIRETLAGKEDDNLLKRESLISDRVRNMNESVIKDADKIHEAIAADKKIAFRYFHRLPNKKEERKYSKDGKVTIVSPYTMLWDNGNYYLYAFVTEENKFRTYRIDRMDRISDPLLEKRDGKDLYKEKEVTNKGAVVFNMYHGKKTPVSFDFEEHITDAIFDTFGTNLIIIPKGKGFYSFSATVELSPPFYAWVATFGRSIKITSPEVAVKGMKEFLKRASEMYQDK